MQRKHFLIGLTTVSIAFVTCTYFYLFQNHRNIAKETPTITMEASDLLRSFQDFPNHEVLNKTVQVSGLISDIEANAITLNKSVYCVFSEMPSNLKLEETITIKGRCVGYDELFEQVQMDQCIQINR
ncbi:hypothetical protein [Luteirhabdus pelagi]|uniref:hypothetical protein n=1 Tax=Luteirhabdus pelagi TaxID=2792783 RepID=UPI0019399545|nr:hypothetical protein [Luteirhabdus pelagi]